SIVLSPPERGMTPATREASTRSSPSSPPSVAGLPHSIAPRRRVVAPSRTSETLIVILLCSVRSAHRQRVRDRLKITGKPREPTNTPSAIGRHTHQSPTYGTRPSGVGTKPALLNAETA